MYTKFGEFVRILRVKNHQVMGDMAKRIEERPFAILDINMGCPVPKVVNNGEGSALMKDPKLAANIVSKVSKAISKPVTVKFRKGFNDANINAVEFAKYMEDAGAKAVAVHGRTREQYYSGAADWEIIAKVKDAISIPVIGNGDVKNAKDAIRIQEETGCDGVMIGRAAQGNPWIFAEVLHYMEHGIFLDRPSKDQVRAMIKKHATLMLECKGEYIGIREMRKHVAWYTAGYPGSARLRKRICEIEHFEELDQVLNEL